MASVAFHTIAAMPRGNQPFSENGRYSVELTRTPEKKLIVAVFQHTNSLKGLLWSRPIDWEEWHPDWSSTSVHEVKALVTNDGKTVLLRDWGTPEEKNGIRIIGAGEKEDVHLRPFEKALTGADSEDAQHGIYRHQFTEGASYWHIGALIDFVLEDDKTYAIWFGQTDQWLLISLKDYKSTVVRDSAQIGRLNSLARRRVEPLVLEHQPAPLRRVIDAIKERIGKLVPALASTPPLRWSSPEVMTGYLFLAARKEPADKIFIERLATFPMRGVQQHGNIIGAHPVRFSFISGPERVLGDFLLSRWNGDTNREFIPRETYLMLPDEPLKYLGTVRAQFELPIPIPDDKGGNIWAYLIPAHIPPGRWTGNVEVITYVLSLAQFALQAGSVHDSKLEAVFKEVLPGEYRLKLVWERRPLAAFRPNNGFYAAAPGDYESTESKPFVIKAGESRSDITINCTNRIGDAKAYEADDALTNAKPKIR